MIVATFELRVGDLVHYALAPGLGLALDAQSCIPWIIISKPRSCKSRTMKMRVFSSSRAITSVTTNWECGKYNLYEVTRIWFSTKITLQLTSAQVALINRYGQSWIFRDLQCAGISCTDRLFLVLSSFDSEISTFLIAHSCLTVDMTGQISKQTVHEHVDKPWETKVYTYRIDD